MKQYENISLKAYNTFGIDVQARRLLLLEPGDEVPQLADPYLVLGAGSDVVFIRDYEGTVVVLAHQCRVERGEGDTVTAWGGMVMDDLVQWTLDHGLYGMENLSAIPGTVGASVVQNVGAYGVEAKDLVVAVHAYDLRNRAYVDFSSGQCCFAYRTSLFKQQPGRYLVLGVTYRLSSTFTPVLTYRALESLPHGTAQQLREAIAALRWQKLPRPEEHGSAGSFFKNPVVDEATYRRIRDAYPDMPDAHPEPQNRYKLSAGWLIDRAGWKGRVQGGAGVWPHNALVLYNAGGCTGDEVVALAQTIQQDVLSKFGVALVPEAIIV